MSMSEVLQISILNLTLTNVDTEYSQALPAGCKFFSIQAQDDQPFRWSNVTGKVATPTAPYATVKGDSFYNSPEKFTAKPDTTIYFGTDTAGQVIEIICHIPVSII